MELVVASVGAFLVTALLLLALRIPARIVGLVDRPGGHKTHRAAVPALRRTEVAAVFERQAAGLVVSQGGRLLGRAMDEQGGQHRNDQDDHANLIGA